MQSKWAGVLPQPHLDLAGGIALWRPAGPSSGSAYSSWKLFRNGQRQDAIRRCHLPGRSAAVAPERPTRFPTHIGLARRAYKGRLGLATPADSLLRIALPRDVPRPPRPAVDTRGPYPTWRWIYRQGHCSQYASLPALQIAFAALHQRLLLLSAKAKRPGTVSQFAVASFISRRCKRALTGTANGRAP